MIKVMVSINGAGRSGSILRSILESHDQILRGQEIVSLSQSTDSRCRPLQNMCRHSLADVTEITDCTFGKRYYHKRTMTKGSKFVAMTVAILVLATPVLASSSCWLPMAMTSDDAEHCLMMGVQPSFVSARQSPVSMASCCAVSVAAGILPSAVRTPNTGAIGIIESSVVSISDIPAIAPQRMSSESPGSDSSPRPQALLCTFLI